MWCVLNEIPSLNKCYLPLLLLLVLEHYIWQEMISNNLGLFSRKELDFLSCLKTVHLSSKSFLHFYCTEGLLAWLGLGQLHIVLYSFMLMTLSFFFLTQIPPYWLIVFFCINDEAMSKAILEFPIPCEWTLHCFKI